MAHFLLPYVAEFEDGKTLKVVADQRDIAAYEAYSEGASYRHGSTRYMCWNALVRQKKTTLSWEKFQQTCIEVVDDPDAKVTKS